MMAAVSLLIPFEPVQISPLPVTSWVDATVVFVTVFFNGPFGDGDAFVTVVVVVFLMGVNLLAAVAVVVRVVVVKVDALAGRLAVVVVVVVVVPPNREVVVFVATFDNGLCWRDAKIRKEYFWKRNSRNYLRVPNQFFW